MSTRLRRLAAVFASVMVALGSLASTQALAYATPALSLAAPDSGSLPVGLTARLGSPSPGVTRSLAPLTDPTAIAARPGTQVGGTPAYVDDRSSGAAVILSYYNAIHRQEYDRAYSYWVPDLVVGQIGGYQSFRVGFADTRSFSATLGQTRVDHAAGQIYNFVPVALTALSSDGATRAYSICFALHLSDPQIQNSPPFDPWAIESARVRRLAAGTSPSMVLDTACSGEGFIPPSAAQTLKPDDIFSSRYLDDRSTPEEVLRSLFNAVNSREYDRAYSYWEPGAVGLAPYQTFAAGYSDTASVELMLGKTQVGMGAGQLYFDVPVTLVAQNTRLGTQTYVGCYTLHLSQPTIQDQPPYQPLAIRSASVRQVSNGANTAALMARACPVR